MTRTRHTLLSLLFVIAYGAGTAAAQTANLGITKTDGAATSVPGTGITYTIVASNPVGPDAAPGSTVTDTFPAALTGVTWTCVGAGGGTCTAAGAGNIADLVNLPVGGSVTYTVNATIAPGATGMLSNTATVTVPGGFVDPVPGNNSATDTNTLTPTANLAITKTDGAASSVPGTGITYTIVASNAGPSAVTGATVTDNFPAALSGITWTCVASGGSSCTGAGAGNIADAVNLLPGGTATYTVNATISSTATGSLSNTATIAAPGGVTDPALGNNSATDTNSLTPQVNLGISKTDGAASSIPGTPITYTIIASNAGPSAVTGATVTDTFPAALSGITWTCVASGGSSCPGAGAGNIAAAVNLLVGGTATFTVNATINSGATGTLVNTATITVPPGTTETAPANNSATDTNSLTPQADLSITKTDLPDPVVAGTNLVYSITITNHGPSDAVSVGLVDTLPFQVNFVSSIPGGPTCAHALGVVTCSLGTLVASTSTNVTITVAVPSSVVDGVVISNTAVTSSSTADPGPNPNVAVQTTLVEREPDLGVSKTSPFPVIAGTSFDYTVTVENNGPSDASMVVLTDTLPGEVTFVSAVGCMHDGAPFGGDVTCNIGNLVAGASQVFTITVFVEPCTLPGTLMLNEAEVTHNPAETDPGPTPNTFSLLTLVNTLADLSITKVESQDPVLAGDDFFYTVTITNAGPSCARDVDAVDTLPDDVLFLDGRSDATCFSPISGTVVCSQGILTPGQVVTFDIWGRVDCAADDGSIQTNTITVTSSTPDPVAANNTDIENTLVETLTDISLTKTAAPDPVQPASLLTYNFDIRNTGPSNANNVVLTDELPAGVTFNNGTEGCVANGSTVVCDVGVVPCGKVSRVRIRVRVETAESPLVNTASVETSTPETTTANNSSTVSSGVRNVPRYILRLNGAPRFLHESGVDTAIYMIRVQNKTLIASPNAVLVNILPASLELVESMPAPTVVDGQVLTYELGSLAPGETRTILIEARLIAGTSPGTALANVASLTVGGEPIESVTFTGSVRAPRLAVLGQLKASLTTLRRVLAGSRLTSTINIDNTGGVEAKDVVVTMTAPAALQLETAIPPASSVATVDGLTVLTWNIDSIRGPGKGRVRVTQRVPNGLPGGTALPITVDVVDHLNRTGSDSDIVEVRN